MWPVNYHRAAHSSDGDDSDGYDGDGVDDDDDGGDGDIVDGCDGNDDGGGEILTYSPPIRAYTLHRYDSGRRPGKLISL